MHGADPAARRLLVQGVLASTLQLVRSMRDGADVPVVRRQMLERRQMLARLSLQRAGVACGATAALQAAVEESDLTLETLLA